MSDEAVIAEQQQFIDWLQSKGMYSGFESVQVMRKSMRVWQEMRKEIQERIDDIESEDRQGWCGHCACQSCYEAKRAADHW